jgi:alcohol dehydrogenase
VAINRGRDKEAFARGRPGNISTARQPTRQRHFKPWEAQRRSLRPLPAPTPCKPFQGAWGQRNHDSHWCGCVLTVNSLDLLAKRASVKGWYSGIAADSEDTLLFSQLKGIASMNEAFPLEQAQAAYDRMMSGKARCRVVLKIDQ